MTVSAIQELPNRVNAAADEATVGSTTGVDTNDPTGLTHDGDHYIRVPGTADNNFSVPDEAALDIVGDLEIVLRLSAFDWTPASTSLVLTKGTAYSVSTLASGDLRLNHSGANYDSTVVVPFTDADWQWIKITRRQSDGRIQFLYAADQSIEPSSWTQLGADVTGATSDLSTNSTALSCGGVGATLPFGGEYKRVIVRDGIDGTTVLDVNPANDIDTTSDPDAGQSSFTATTGQTVTVNRGTSGLTTAVVTRPVALLDGTDDYIQLPASDTPTFTATTGKHTFVVCFRKPVANASGSKRFLSFEGAVNDGVHLFIDPSDNIDALVGGASALKSISGGAHSEGTMTVAAVIIDDGTAYVYDSVNGRSAGSDITTVGTITFASGRVGSRAYTVADLHPFEFFNNLQFPGVALTEAQLDTLSATLIAGDYS